MNLHYSQQVEPFVILACGDQRHETSVGRGENFTWKENFIFNILTGMEDLNIVVNDFC